MKLAAGLFICDHVSPEMQKEFGDYPDMFADLFPEFEWKLYDVINGHFPKNINECEIYMATGSRHSVYENIDWINRTKELIREIYIQDKYFIGICFGHQLLGAAMGGEVEKSPNGWCVGVHEFNVSEKRKWMSPFFKKINLLMMCQDQVLELPKEAIRLAGNKLCPNGMIQVGEKMLGIQAHPEFSKRYDGYLMELRKEKIGGETVGSGMKSMSMEVDKEIIRNWILRFLEIGGHDG